MEFEIIKEKENPLFGRKEIQISVEAQVTPSRNEIKNLIVQKFSTQPENISIKGIHGKFGSKNFMINANIYSSKQDKDNMEPKSKKGTEESSESKKVEVQQPEQTKESTESDNKLNQSNEPEASEQSKEQ